MRISTVTFLLLAVGVANAHLTPAGFRHVRRSDSTGVNPSIDNAIGQPAPGPLVDPTTIPGVPSTTDTNEQKAPETGTTGSKPDTGTDPIQRGPIKPVPGNEAKRPDGGNTDAKDKLNGSDPKDDGTKKYSDALINGDGSQSTQPMAVSHGDYGSYPAFGASFQQFYSFSPWIYIASIVATGAKDQAFHPYMTLGVCRCNRPFASFADGTAPALAVTNGSSKCLTNVLAASAASAQCRDAGIDGKECLENGVPAHLETGDKLWWQRTFCKRCVDAGGESDPQFACPDDYADLGGSN